jgi:CubicO group peptidase (beta-lactamase class C family)
VAAPGAACDLAGYRPGANGFLFSPQGGLRASAPDLAVIGAALLRPRPPAAAPSRRALLTAPSLAALFAAVPTHAGAPPGETAGGLMRAWGAGAQCLTGDPADTPVPAARGWCGHMGEAYGLHAGLWVDRAGGRAVAYIVTGAAADPHPRPGGSRFTPFEDAIFAALARP